MSPVLDATVALDGRHDEAAEKAHHVDDKGDGNRFCRGERGNRRERAAEQRRATDAADGADDGFRRRQRRHDFLAAKEFAPDVLQHVARLHHRDEKERQQDVVRVAGDVQVQKRRDMRDAVHRNHHRPLRRRRAREEVAAVAGERGSNGHEEEGIDRDEGGEQHAAALINQPVLQRQDDVVAQHHHAVIAAAAVNQREKLAQGEEGHQPEQENRAAATDGKGGGEYRRHQPPGMDAGAQVQQCRRGAAAGDERIRDAAGGEQNQQDAGKQPGDEVFVHKPRSSCRSTGCCASNVAWAKARKSSFSVKSPPRKGWPKRTLHSIGTGSSLPLGSTRWML